MEEKISIIKQYLEEKKRELYECFGKDYKENNLNITYNELMEVFNNIDLSDINTKGGTIAAIYNGDEYLTLELIVKGIIYGNNIILIRSNESIYTSNIIIDIMQELIKREKWISIIKAYSSDKTDKILEEEDFIDRVIYIGDKREYSYLKSKTEIEIMYNGFTSINVFVDDEDEFEDELYTLAKYAYDKDWFIYKILDDLDEAIDEFNYNGNNNICIILSKDESKIEKFKKEIKANNILVNEVNVEKLQHNLEKELFIF